jgi:hypothetical protein
MLKKIVLVGALAVASFLSLNLAARTSAPQTEARSQQLAAKWPPCENYPYCATTSAQP